MASKPSRQIAFRTPRHRPQPPSKKGAWRPTGPFRLFDLPPELRTRVLELAILSLPPRDVPRLLRASRAVYAEAGALFYREVVLDTTRATRTTSSGVVDAARAPAAFLSRPLGAGAGVVARLGPRAFVRSLTVQFRVREHAHLFASRYAAALAEMARAGCLRRLRLEVHAKFPPDDFWGGGGEEEGGGAAQERLCLVTAGTSSTTCRKDSKDGNEKGGDAAAFDLVVPLYVTKAPFQSFLAFLRDAPVPRVSLHVDARDHDAFWCRYHREGRRACRGQWRGPSAGLLRVRWKRLVEELLGARRKQGGRGRGVGQGQGQGVVVGRAEG